MTNDPQLGWGGDHVGKLSRLQTAVRILAEGQGKTAERLEKATYALATLLPRDFPERLRERATKVLQLREDAADHGGNYTHFRFADMTVAQRKRFIADLIALYEACLIDLGRTWPQWDFMYPKSEPAKTATRRKTGKHRV
jgi:hypothetical protein